MEKQPRQHWRVAFCTWALLTSIASGATLYDNFGQGDSFNPNPLSGYLLQHMPSFYQFISGSFLVPGNAGDSFTLNSVDVAMRGDGVHPILLQIQSNQGGIPGQVIESAPTLSGSAGVYSIHFSGNTRLEAGHVYWVTAEASLGLSGAGTWFSNITGQQGLAAANGTDPNTGLNWVLDPVASPAFRVNGTLDHNVPDVMPTWTVLLASYGFFVIVNRPLRRASQRTAT